MDDGATAIIRRHGNPDGPRLVLSHGCGFASDLYYPYWSLLTDRFDVVVYDLRSHGWNPVSPLRAHNMPTLVDDNRRILRAVDENFGPKPSIAIFHSWSTITALIHEQQEATFAAMVLFDAPIYPPGYDLGQMETVVQRLAKGARRQSSFDSREVLFEALSQASAFSLVPRETLMLFAETRLRPASEGGFELCCPPEHEAQLFEYYFGWSMQAPEVLQSIEIPIKVIGADPTAAFSFLPSMDLSTLLELDYDFIPDTTHFLPLEMPERCAAMTVEFLEEHGLA